MDEETRKAQQDEDEKDAIAKRLSDEVDKAEQDYNTAVQRRKKAVERYLSTSECSIDELTSRRMEFINSTESVGRTFRTFKNKLAVLQTWEAQNAAR